MVEEFVLFTLFFFHITPITYSTCLKIMFLGTVVRSLAQQKGAELCFISNYIFADVIFLAQNSDSSKQL